MPPISLPLQLFAQLHVHMVAECGEHLVSSGRGLVAPTICLVSTLLSLITA